LCANRTHANSCSMYSVQHHHLKYWTISFKLRWGVMRDPFYLSDISAAAEFLRDTLKISAFELKFLSFLPFFFFF
jgi:hypothetical protein